MCCQCGLLLHARSPCRLAVPSFLWSLCSPSSPYTAYVLRDSGVKSRHNARLNIFWSQQTYWKISCLKSWNRHVCSLLFNSCLAMLKARKYAQLFFVGPSGPVNELCQKKRFWLFCEEQRFHGGRPGQCHSRRSREITCFAATHNREMLIRKRTFFANIFFICVIRLLRRE